MTNEFERDAGFRMFSAGLRAVEALFDGISDTVFFAKDRQGRYVSVNRTLVDRLGKRHKAEVIGRSAIDLFPEYIARSIDREDLATFAGRSLSGTLQLHLFPGGGEGWCMTWKEPLLGLDGAIVGLAGISRDVEENPAGHGFEALSAIIEYIQSHLDEPLRTPELARRHGLSTYKLDRRMRDLHGLSVSQFVARARIEHALQRLRQSDDPIAHVALDCGYGDQAAFTRQFRRAVGLTPSAYRGQARDRRGRS